MGTRLAQIAAMNLTQLRAVLGAMLWVAAIVVACNKSKAEETLAGPQLGESTASPPANPNAPPPDAPGVTGVSASLRAPVGNSGAASGAAPVSTSGTNTAAQGANSGTAATPASPPTGTSLPQDRTQTLPQDTAPTLPQDRNAPPAEPPRPGVFSPPPDAAR